MTETAPIVSFLDAEHVKEKAGSIGRTAFHVEARIVDDADNDVPVDEVGELVVRGLTYSRATGVFPRRQCKLSWRLVSYWRLGPH